MNSKMLLVILKVHGNAIHLRQGHEGTLRLFCHDLEAPTASHAKARSAETAANVVASLPPANPANRAANDDRCLTNSENNENNVNGNDNRTNGTPARASSGPATSSPVKVFVLGGESSEFETQSPPGAPVGAGDLAYFMGPPKDSQRAKAVSYAFSVSISHTASTRTDLGTAFLCLEPKFATQGIQRMQIVSHQNRMPIGYMQVEYLIVKNPTAYGAESAKPAWLEKIVQRPLDAGHRGAGSGCRADLPVNIVENTIASFNYAARHGADMCELDVMCTSDGVPVVYHNYIIDTKNPKSIQIDQMTLEQLRNLNNITTHDKNCPQPEQCRTNTLNNKRKPSSERPFPTMEEVLRYVDKECALNIEVKWPQLLPSGKSEAIHYREINDFVDRILDCIQAHSGDRAIMLSSLNATIAIMLRLKQTKYPVLFLTTGDCKRFDDPATKSVENAIQFAQAFKMAGINPNAAYLTDCLVRDAKRRGLLVYAWGSIESAQAIQDLKRTGLNGVIYDKIDLIKPARKQS